MNGLPVLDEPQRGPVTGWPPMGLLGRKLEHLWPEGRVVTAGTEKGVK